MAEMVPFKPNLNSRFSPPSLMKLCIKKTISVLETSFQRSRLDPTMVGGFLCYNLPMTVRQQLLEEVLSGIRHFTDVHVPITEALLVPDLQRLAIGAVGKPYRQGLLDLLISGRGIGLRVLLFEDTAWLSGNCASSIGFCYAMPHLTHLRKVSLRGVCDDILLGYLGAYCPNLAEVCAAGSPLVTDIGIQKMCLYSEPQDDIINEPENACEIFVHLYAKDSIQELRFRPGWWHSSIVDGLTKNACCQSLRLMHLSGTRVTFRGFSFLRLCAPFSKLSYH